MVEKLDQCFELECQPLPRSYWNSDTGKSPVIALTDGQASQSFRGSNATIAAELALLWQLQISESLCENGADARFYALSALAAALRYVERAQGIAFIARSLRVSYVALEGRSYQW
jgi:hypothetical protein